MSKRKKRPDIKLRQRKKIKNDFRAFFTTNKF